jgi:ParB family chromosome partitioning protein
MLVTVPTLTALPIHAISPNPLQPRKQFDDEAIQELAASLKVHGVVQPVVVTRRGDSYLLVVGERRWRAAQVAGLTHIPAVVRDYSEVEVMQVALVENLQRQDLNPIEEAQAIAFLLKEYGMTQEVLAAKLGKSRPALSNATRLLQLPPDLQQDVVNGTVSAGHARALLAITDPTLQRKVWQKVRQDQLSVRETEALARRIQEGPVAKRPGRATPEALLDWQNELERRLQTQVVIRTRGKNSGRIELSYGSADELDRLLDSLTRIGAPRRRVDLDLL